MRKLCGHIVLLGTWLRRAAIGAGLCVLVAASGCVPAEEGAEPPAADGLCRASILVAVGGEMTRAIPEGDYEDGSDTENAIDVAGGDFRIMLFGSDDTLLCPLVDVAAVRTAPGSRHYLVSGLLDADAVAEARSAVKAVMLANWKGAYPDVTPGLTTIASLAADSEAAFDFTADGTPGSRNIPMFGVTNLLEGLSFAENESTQLGTLHLLRAYAKVRVRADGESLPLESVRLTLANPAAMLAPAGVSRQDDYLTGAYATDFTGRPTLPEGVRATTDVPLAQVAENEWALYVPEFRNTIAGLGSAELSDAARARIAVTFTGSSATDYVDFRYYSAPPEWSGAREGDHFDILRNNIYDFTLAKTAGETDVTISVDVQPYASVEVRPEPGLDRDEEGNIIVERYEDGTYKILTASGAVIRDADGDRVIRYFSDGSLLCEETIERDYIHDETETTYVSIFEKDAPGGNMVILRQNSDCTACTGENPGDTHDHDTSDRPLFVLDKEGHYHRVVYNAAGTPTLTRTDAHGDTITQVNGYQFRTLAEMRPYIGTYVVRVKNADGSFREELRRASDASTID